MSRESLAYAVSCTCLGVLIGWVIGSQRSGPAPAAAPQAASAQSGNPGGSEAPPPLDVQKVADLERLAKADPKNVGVRIDLANLYYDAKRFDQAIPWYQAALEIDPKDVNASTDLAVCFYMLNQHDRALTQIDRSLSLDGKHAKTLLNQGIIRAFGKQDLKGATESWERVLAVAPGTDEARFAQQGLDGIRSAHGGSATGSGSAGSGGR